MINNLITLIAQSLDNNNIPYMIIGGQAALIYGNPRLTQDIDITLGIDNSYLEKIITVCGELNLKILPENVIDFVKQVNVVPAIDIKSKIRVDFIFSFIEYEHIAISRARLFKIKKYKVKFASPEDFIIHKLFAGRPRDLEDVRIIMLNLKDKIDKKYLQKWISEFSQIEGKEYMICKFKEIFCNYGN